MTAPNKQGIMWSAQSSLYQLGVAPVERNPYPALYM
jgi:hypothetical protein